MHLREGLGFEHLTSKEQQAYRLILKAFSAMSTSFDCSPIDRRVDLMKVIQVVLGDNPALIYLDKTQARFVGSTIQLTGLASKSRIAKMNAALDTAANTIVASVGTNTSDAYSRLIQVYEFLQKHVRYDHQELLAYSKGKSKNQNSHNAYGALLEGLAVCSGFSAAFALLAQKLGFACMSAIGRSAHRSTGFVEHAWNIVKVGSHCYHMDVTWDANQFAERGVCSYDYFALTDEEMVCDHDWDIQSTPACSVKDFSYYVKNGLYANSTGQLDDIIKHAVKTREVPVRVKLSYRIGLPADAEEYLAQLVMDEAMKSGHLIQIEYSWNEYTRCFYAKIMD